jgi:hypothetical protein
MATTTKRDDYLGRDLVTPASDAKDFMGRAATATADYLGRLLTRTLRANTTAVALGDLIEFTAGSEYTVTVAGTTAASAPSVPAVGDTVVDGTATLLRTQ